jgi:hypothetical protein
VPSAVDGRRAPARAAAWAIVIDLNRAGVAVTGLTAMVELGGRVRLSVEALMIPEPSIARRHQAGGTPA